MANSIIKPQAGDTLGLAAAYSGMGQDVKNAQVMATHFNYTWSNDQIQFEALYFYNSTHRLAWLTNPEGGAVVPMKRETYFINTIDLNKSIVDQCLDYLLTLEQFNGGQSGSLVWVKS